MSRGKRAHQEPWVEQTILNYGKKEAYSSRLWAHVVGVGQMTESQAQGDAGQTLVLFLSDGVVQIPALLTQQAWDTLQEQEERECLSSLTNCTVCINLYSLQFHMGSEKTRCRFFLRIDELITMVSGAAKDSPPCCTTLPSVRQQICETWRSLSGQDSVLTQNVFSLSELLGEWKDEHREQLLQNVRELLRTPSSAPSGWAADRLTYQGEERFSVPASYLTVPQEQELLFLTSSDEGSPTQSGLVPLSQDRQTDGPTVALHMDTVQPITEQSTRQSDVSILLERGDPDQETTVPGYQATLPGYQTTLPGDQSTLPGDQTTLPGDQTTLPGECVRGEEAPAPRDNPWDMFVPLQEMLSTSSSSDVSTTSERPHESPSVLPTLPAPAPPAPLPVATSTQAPSPGSKVSQRSEDHSLPPYQRPRPCSSLAPSSRPCTGPSPLPHPPLPGQQPEEEEAGGQERRSRGNVGEPVPAAGLEEGGGLQGLSPPSWLFQSPLAPGNREEGPGCRQTLSGGPDAGGTTNVHSDGSVFSYSYQPSDRLRQDLYQLKVPDSLLAWAVKYLLPAKQTDVAKVTRP